MRVHIDWLTFTMAMIYPDGLTGEEKPSDVYAETIRLAFLRTFGDDLSSLAFGGTWSQKERSRAPYSDAWSMGDNVTVFSSPSLVHMCVEISGTGCEWLISRELMDSVLARVHERVTRIDIACDIETKTTPPEFISAIIGKRMQSSGYQKSSRGETCYVGSQKSDRYARVYRYAAPHPRSHLLRVEHVFRKDYAKQVAWQSCGNKLESVAKACGKAFGWGHKDYVVAEVLSAPLSPVKSEKNMGGTVAWLVTAAAPAFRRMVAEGTISNPEQFLRKYFLSETMSH